ncbi:MAG: hypothetical protein ABFC57_09025 [Veillonellales bacterium]
MEFAQIIMVVTLILMISGRVPIYLTAVIGSSIAAMVAGFPFGGKGEITIVKLINSGLHPVIADMVGVLVFIGIMERTGFLNAIIVKIMEAGRKLGGGPGVCTAGGIAAGIIGALTGFTQPAITAVITGPAAVELGVDPSKAAGVQAHAGNFGNFAGFTHPTMVAIIATAGIGFGMLNVIGAVCTLAIFAVSFYRLRQEDKNRVIPAASSFDELAAAYNGENQVSFSKAIFPFVILVIGFAFGYPILLVGVLSSLIVALLAGMPLAKGENAMMEGVNRIAIPLFATIAFLYMSSVINKVGLVSLLSDWFAPYLKLAPIQIMLLVSALTGLVTQSNAASAAIVVPFLQIVLKIGADPFAAAVAAVGGCAIMQYFLTGGPVSALATVIPVIPDSELKAANRFQRPSILVGLLITFIFTFFI